jgi:hypothetical protein
MCDGFPEPLDGNETPVGIPHPIQSQQCVHLCALGKVGWGPDGHTCDVGNTRQVCQGTEMVNIAWTGKHPTQGQDEPKCITPPTHYKQMIYVREKPLLPDGTCAKNDWNCRLNNSQKNKLEQDLARISDVLGNLWVKLTERRSLLNDRVLLDS